MGLAANHQKQQASLTKIASNRQDAEPRCRGFKQASQCIGWWGIKSVSEGSLLHPQAALDHTSNS